eukprot:6480705-Amphidinium_carterae.1
MGSSYIPVTLEHESEARPRGKATHAAGRTLRAIAPEDDSAPGGSVAEKALMPQSLQHTQPLLGRETRLLPSSAAGGCT